MIPSNRVGFDHKNEGDHRKIVEGYKGTQPFASILMSLCSGIYFVKICTPSKSNWREDFLVHEILRSYPLRPSFQKRSSKG